MICESSRDSGLGCGSDNEATWKGTCPHFMLKGWEVGSHSEMSCSPALGRGGRWRKSNHRDPKHRIVSNQT